MFWFAGRVAKSLGIPGVLCLSLASYILRFCVYATVTDPRHALIAELMRGLTFGAFWSTATYYAHNLSPDEMPSTMLAFLSGTYGGLGQSLGSIVGGKLQSMYGTVKTFAIGAGFDVVVLGLVLAYWHFNPDMVRDKVGR